MHELLHDIALCIIAAWALGVLSQALRQPRHRSVSLVLRGFFVPLFWGGRPGRASLKARALWLPALGVVTLVERVFAARRFFPPPLFHRVARLPELVLVGAISWCFL